jgi:hypothetical protein
MGARGGRMREEVQFGPSWIGYVATGVEYTTIQAVNTLFPGGVLVLSLSPPRGCGIARPHWDETAGHLPARS